MLYGGYLLNELMIALMLVVLSATSFIYYGYHLAQCQGDALRECYALSLASDYLNLLIATRNTEENFEPIQHGEYSLNGSIASVSPLFPGEESGEYQKRFRFIEVAVTWKTSSRIPRTVTILSGMIADEETRI